MLPLKPSKMINLTSGEFCGKKGSGDLFSPPRINFLAIDAIYQNFHNLLCLMTCYSTFCLILIKTVICQIVEHFFCSFHWAVCRLEKKMKLTANVSNWTWFTQMVGFNEIKKRFVTFRRRKKLLSFADMYSYDY